MRNRWGWILGLWVLVSLFNFTKAFHMDDAFHMEAAQWISGHPSQPMSGQINWGESDPAPIWTFNNPPLFFYLMAGVGQWMGFSEISMHALVSVFVLLAIYFFDLLVRFFLPSGSWVLMVLFAFCPAFIVNQNVMLDIPVLAMLLGFAYFLLLSAKGNEGRNYLISLILLTLGAMMKYSLVPLFPLVWVVIMYKKQNTYLWVLAVPLVVFGAWSVWNMIEFGSLHLIRPTEVPLYLLPFKMVFSLVAFLACLGAISFYTFLVSSKGPFYWWLVGLWSVTTLLSILYLKGYVSGYFFDKVLYLTFFTNGLGVVLGFYPMLRRKLFSFKNLDTWDNEIVLGQIVISLAIFLVMFAPFMATRHVLLLIPFVLILSREPILNSPARVRGIGVLLTMVIGVALGISDWKYADYYREMAADVKASAGARRVWTVGHWGWQWYSVQQGFRPYHTHGSKPQSGDWMVFPKQVSSQQLDPSLKLHVLNKIWKERPAFLPVSGSEFGGMYLSNFSKNPWTVSSVPFDTIIVAEVVGNEE